jgi:LNS2 (Lipin/Ned1/Smp2)
MATLDHRHPHQQSQSSLTEETDDAVYDSLDSFAACFCCNPFENFLPEFISVQGQAFDVIVIQSASTGRVASSDFRINFEHPTTPFPPKESTMETEHCEALLEVVDEKLGKVYFPIDHHSLHKRCRLRGTPKCDSMTRSAACQARSRSEAGTEQETLQLLAKMLTPGRNDVRYLFRTENRVLGIAIASVYLWHDTDKVVVCDVDGTITKSNIRGIYDTIVAEKYMHCHEKVCAFLTRVKNGGKEHHDDENPQQPIDDRPKVNILYLSSRPLAIANSTRKFLSKVRQPQQEEEPKPKKSWSKRSLNNSKGETTAPEEQHRLPDGPLIGFPGKLTEVLKMEMVTHSVHLFKASTLLEQVVTPFCDASGSQEIHDSMFIAGFGWMSRPTTWQA